MQNILGTHVAIYVIYLKALFSHLGILFLFFLKLKRIYFKNQSLFIDIFFAIILKNINK